jgi:hypothetical protein
VAFMHVYLWFLTPSGPPLNHISWSSILNHKKMGRLSPAHLPQ